MYPQNLEILEKTIGYTFNDKSIIISALTHSSFANENRMSGKYCECNERLEFLGDSVLSLIVSEYIFHKFFLENGPADFGTLQELAAAMG